MRKLFGTDGIRGVAGKFPLDRPTAYAFGQALGEWATHEKPGGTVLLGMDTRESGPWLAQAVAAGLHAVGAQVQSTGIITTPGLAYLTKVDDFVAGVMISASHNPFADNGLKVFDHSGYKLPDAVEAQLEARLLALAAHPAEPQPVNVQPYESLCTQYLDYLAATVRHPLHGIRVLLDGANGGASYLAPQLFTRLGATLETINVHPDGRNINLHCGALHVEQLRDEVLRRGAHAGVAFDGDADRAILVSGSGKVIDGDHVLLVSALQLLRHGKLATASGERVVVATVMSNLGLEVALRNHGIALGRTAVGDKYVLEEMRRIGAPLGGEQSGHVIFHEHATTGDGMLTAVRVLETMAETGLTLDELTAEFQVYPQILVNIRIVQKRPLEELPAVQTAIRDAETAFQGSGRVLVRFSGTEPLARVMVEGADQELVTFHVHRIADTLKEALT